MQKAQADVTNMIADQGKSIVTRKSHNINYLIEVAGKYLNDVPYGGAEGEGNLCDTTFTHNFCMHIQQDPIYRTDTLNGMTFVELVLGLVNANNLADFQNNIIKLEYGAEANAGHITKWPIAYSNRNNFADGDFNPFNERNGLLTDVTDRGIFHRYASSITANITRARWFAFQAKPDVIANNVRVFDDYSGKHMSQNFSHGYADFYKPEIVATPYIPKFSLVLPIMNGTSKVEYIPNDTLINQIPTPSVVEVIRDDRKWFINGVNIVDLIGSGTSVSHMGFLYHKHFKKDAIIYQKTNCYLNSEQQNICTVTPVVCTQNQGCTKTMMLATTNVYPEGFLWSQNITSGTYSCTDPSKVPAGAKFLSSCNRVTSMPFGDYITFQDNNVYSYLSSPSIVGFNIQKINSSGN